jgi:hypothetical protein
LPSISGRFPQRVVDFKHQASQRLLAVGLWGRLALSRRDQVKSLFMWSAGTIAAYFLLTSAFNAINVLGAGLQ